MKTIGGSIFVRNAIRLDYCIEEAVNSLLGFCDEVVVLDCYSGDGTLELLQKIEKRESRLRVMGNGTWDCHPGYQKMAILANMAKDQLKTEWQFMLQADEVVHENSFQKIRELIEAPNINAYFCRRINMFGDMDHSVNLTSNRRPCGDTIVRLAKKYYNATGDAESLELRDAATTNITDLLIFHYGFVRRGMKLVEKAIEIQSWFHGGPGVSTYDKKLDVSKAEGVFIADDYVPASEYIPIPCEHPKFSKVWVEERRNDPTRRIKR